MVALGLSWLLTITPDAGIDSYHLVGGLQEACSLDILFLRRDQPGALVTHGGDIDNRMKVLLDALRMPDGCHEVCGNTPTADEEPFFCLLTDDRLITEIRIVTDRLLTPLETHEYIHDVHLIIHVKTVNSDVSLFLPS